MAPQILINLKIKWTADTIISIPVAPLPDPIIPITPPDPIIPILPDGTEIDITTLWYDTFKTGSGTLILESGKTYSISTVKRITITGKLRIKTTGAEPAYLWVGKSMYILYINEGEDTVLFELTDGADVLIDNVYPSIREQNRNVQQMYSVNWFSSIQNPDVQWIAVVKNCDSTYLAENGGFGIGLVYGGTKENYIALINYKHAGPMLGELKNPYANGVLYLVLDNVTTNYTDPFQWSKRAHLTKGILSKSDNILKLTSDVEASCLYNHFFNVDKGANRSFLAHIGRFTFMVDTIDAVIDLKTIKLRPSPKVGEPVYVKPVLKPVMEEIEENGVKKLVHKKDDLQRLLYTKERNKFFFGKTEPHVGDSFLINGTKFTISEKLKTESDEWTNNFGKGISPNTIKAPQCFVKETTTIEDGTLLVNSTNKWFVIQKNEVEYELGDYISTFNLFDADNPLYLIYKDDLNFRTTATTKFGDYSILEARGGGHIMYNHRHITIWAKDVDLNSGMAEGNDDPYYRESTLGQGISLGYNIVNCRGFDDEFSNKLITTDKPMPFKISNLK